jgi:hypothetical protein
VNKSNVRAIKYNIRTGFPKCWIGEENWWNPNF